MQDWFNNFDYNAFWQETLLPFFTEWGINIVLAIVIFFVGRLVVSLLTRVIEKLMERSRLDPMLISFTSAIAQTAMLAFVVIAALSELGLNTTSLVAVLGAAGLAVGLALQDSLKNFAAGVLLIIFRPFTTGHWVEVAGVSGTVEKITIFTTQLRTGDNKEITVPNGKIYGDVIVNFNQKPIRRIDLIIGISYDDNIQKARTIIEEVFAADERVLKEPEHVIAVGELADSSVNLWVRPWVNTPDYWSVRWDLVENIKKRFDEENITIPYPQRDVHFFNHGQAPELVEAKPSNDGVENAAA